MINLNSSIAVKSRNPPDRTAAARPPPLIACRSSNSQSTHPESVWIRGRSLATGGVARGTAQYRFPCCYPLRQCAQLAEKEGPAGEGRSREKTTEFVDRRRYREVLKNREIYAPDDDSIKRQIPKIDSRDKGMDLGTREREKSWEFGKVKLRVKARCATLVQPHTALLPVNNFSNYDIVHERESEKV
jgi:hypothetical protein